MKTIYLFSLVLIVFALFIIRPVDYQNPDIELDISGVVEKIHTPCCGDINIFLSGDDHEYYVNRALYNGVNLEEWQRQLEGKEVKMLGLRHSSLLNLSGNHVPIKTLIKDDKVLWTVEGQKTSL